MAWHSIVHFFTFFVVKLGSGFHEQFVETGVFEVAVVPLGVARVGRGKHPVHGETAVPVAHDPGLLEPDHIPVAVGRMVDHFDFDTRLFGMFAVKYGLVSELIKIASMQFKRMVQHTGLLEVEARLVRVILPLGQVRVAELDGGRYGMVIGNGAVAIEHDLDHLLPVDGVLEAQAHVIVVIGRYVHHHGDGVVKSARGLEGVDARHLVQEMDRLDVRAGHQMDGPGLEGIGAGGRVLDHDHFDRVEMGAVGFEKVGVALALGNHAGFEFRLDVGAGADALDPVILAGFRRLDGEMVVAGNKGEVGIAAAKFEDDPVFAVGLDVLDLVHDALGGGFGIFAPVVVDGKDDVLGGHGFAVVEFDAFSEVKGPGLGIRRGFPGFSQLRRGLALVVDLHQAVAVHPVGVVVPLVRQGAGVQVVGGVPAGQPDFEMTAFPGGGGLGRLASRIPGKQQRPGPGRTSLR